MDKELRTKNIVKSNDGFRYMEHTLQSQDTLQGLALKYGSTVADIKRVNKIWKEDTLFLKKNLVIPVKLDDDCEEGSSSTSTSTSTSTSNSTSVLENSSSSSPRSRSNSNSNSKSQYVDNNANNVDQYKQKREMIKAKNVDFFSEFNSKSNYNLNNVLNNKPLPSSDDLKNWKSVPISILSLSPVVNSLDQKTQLTFSLIDDELNPL